MKGFLPPHRRNGESYDYYKVSRRQQNEWLSGRLKGRLAYRSDKLGTYLKNPPPDDGTVTIMPWVGKARCVQLIPSPLAQAIRTEIEEMQK